MKKKVHIPVLLKRNRDFLLTVYGKNTTILPIMKSKAIATRLSIFLS